MKQVFNRAVHTALRGQRHTFSRTPAQTNRPLPTRLFTTLAQDGPAYPGAVDAKFVTELEFRTEYEVRDAFRVLDLEGNLVDPEYKVLLDDDTLLQIYQTMSELRTMDEIYYNAQRQGRVSFYMTSTGEEGSAVGSAAALKPQDIIFTQYREAGVFLWRGFSVENVGHQCYSNTLDLGKGRQMPVHYGSAALNMQTVSSPLATQLPQAVGAAYALKREKADAIAVCYFGEGAASEGDFHTALNFASTTESPVLFFVRNNGYAISTPVREQFRGDGIVSRASGYGMASVRVDGNDPLAVHHATQHARQWVLENQKPCLIEVLSYRGGHHSTSDDSSRYREKGEISSWLEKNHPITRLGQYLRRRELWSDEMEVETSTANRKKVLQGLAAAESMNKPPIDELFTDVYDEMPPHLLEQQTALREHLALYPSKYNLDDFASPNTYVDPSKGLKHNP